MLPTQKANTTLLNVAHSLKGFLYLLLFSALFFAAGCTSTSYPADELRKSVMEICEKEYGVTNVDVKIVGNTIGVYLPLEKLFAADFREAAVTGKIRNLESLFEPVPEAMDKVEDVLFTISRVILSTDRKLDFYILQAADVESTGMQLVLYGYVNDVRRVRVWDISRDEYRKRIVHEFKMNRAARWHRPVRQFFEDLSTKTVDEIKTLYFGEELPSETIQKLFFQTLIENDSALPGPKWEVDTMRSVQVQKDEILVYSKVVPIGADIDQLEYLEFLFSLQVSDEDIRITRIIPFQYRDETGNLHQNSFPKEIKIEENIANWEDEFKVEDIQLGPFLARQMNRRIHAIIAGDERIMNTFREIKVVFDYSETPEPAHFSLDIEKATLADFNNYTRESIVYHEDMLYLLELVSREFVKVMRSYEFGKYDYLQLNMLQEPSAWIIPRDNLELFRKNKQDLRGLLTLTSL